MTENAATFASQNEKAKSEIASQVAKIVRRAGLDYEGWRYVAKLVRKQCDLRPAKKGRRLPRTLTTDHFRRCPGSVEAPAPDGSNVLTPAEQRELHCTEADRAVKP